MTFDLYHITLFGLILAFVEVLGILTAIHAIMNCRTPQGAIAWFFPLVILPFIALPLYWIFGRNRFHGYFVARQQGEDEVQKQVAEKLAEYRRDFGRPLEGDAERFKVCETLAEFPYLAGNTTKLLIDGQETFDAIFRGIESAKEYVFAEFFIIKDDELGREFQRRLIDKAAEGVRVLLLFDEIGSHKLSRDYKRELVEAGVEVCEFYSARGWRNRFQLNFRNHRKIVVVDGKVAYVGGLNIGDEYMGRGELGHWRDTHLELRGPAVAGVQMAFAEDWFWSTGGSHVNATWDFECAADPGQNIVVLPTGPADELESCQLFFNHIIHAARKRVWIASPYFVPDQDIMAALKLAVLRGVDVRIMLPNKADHLLVWLSSFSFMGRAEPVGIKFFRYVPGFLHQKVLIVDDDFAAVGT
ncbi:MAG: cardiolipin synthase, partial [Pirellulales bacterium]|nr:cardiolipin synthase [Pirellulales bacterium]